MSIPPVSPFSYGATPNPSNAIILELQDWMTRYQDVANAWTESPNPATLASLEDCMEKIRQFLENNKDEIFATAQGQGWSLNGPLGSNYKDFFNTAINSIDNFLQHPNDGSLDLVNEGLTQLHWLLTHAPQS